jgi:hypothetical protein
MVFACWHGPSVGGTLCDIWSGHPSIMLVLSLRSYFWQNLVVSWCAILFGILALVPGPTCANLAGDTNKSQFCACRNEFGGFKR